MASFDVEKYTYSISPGTGLTSVGNLCRASLICWSVVYAAGVYWKLFFSMHPYRVWKSGMAFSDNLEMKRLRAVSLPFNPLVSLRVWGDGTSINSSSLVELGCVPLVVT